MEIPALPPTAPFLLLLCLLLISLSSASDGPGARHGLRIDLIHADSNQDLSQSQLLGRAVQRTKLRTSNLSNKPAEASVHLGGGDFIMELALDSLSSVSLRGILDTTTDNSVAQMEHECDQYNNFQAPLQASGYVGLGRGNRSMISQMGATLFSYCFTPLGSNNKSSLLLASQANLNLHQIPKSELQTVKLHKNIDNPSLYYLYLKAVTVGSINLKIHREESYGDGALFIDSRASISALDYNIYEPVLKAFRTQVELQAVNRNTVGLDLCFSLPPNQKTLAEMNFPGLVFHFDGGNMHFPVDNYMGVFQDAGLVCLMMSSFRESILGNFQQQSMRMVFDLEREELSFMKSRCEEL